MKIGLTNIVSCKIGSTQVNRVYIGSTLIWSYSAFDPDAQLFITNAAITEPVQQNAVNTLVINLKGYGIWTKMKALYPFVGGTASQHKFNLKNPLDTDAAFRLVFNGGWTHSSNGIIGNATNTFADTKLIPNLITAQNSFAYGVYSRTNNDALIVDIGAVDSGGVSTMMLPRYGNAFYNLINSGVIYTTSSTADSLGFFVGNRTASNIIKNHKNGVLLTTGSVGSGANNNASIYVGATNHSLNYTSNRQYAFAFISDSLTDTEAANYYTAVQTFQTTLNRQVGVPIVADADAQAFLNAAVITDTTQASAVNTLVTDLKGYGIWTKMKALYPFVGGTAAQHKFNLKNPLDTDAAFRLVFNGGGTHSSTGYLPNLTNAWGDTKLIPNSILTNNNYHLSYYSRTQATGGNASAEMGAVTSNNQAIGLRLYDTGVSGKLFYSGPYPANSVLVANTDSTGFMIGSRISINSAKMFQDSSLLGTNTSTNIGILPTCTMGLCANNFDGGFRAEYSNKECAFSSIGDGLTDAEAANYYTAVQTFQVSLNRQVI